MSGAPAHRRGGSIEATYLRATTLPQPYRDHALQLLRQYVDARLDLDAAGSNTVRVAEASKHAKLIQEELWEDVTELTKTDRSAVMASYMSSLNETIEFHGSDSLHSRIVYLLPFG